MLFHDSLEIEDLHFEPTKKVLIQNGSKVSEQFYGSRRILYCNNEVCGYSQVDLHLPFSQNLQSKKFYNFLATFKRSLYSQFKKNNELLDLKIEFNDLTRDKNFETWDKIGDRSKFYVIDLNSAYWQFAYRLGYISKNVFEKYIDLDEYKEAKRYAISFLARENSMMYYDGREIDHVECDISSLYQVYENVRNEMHNSIDKVVELLTDWIEFNVDSISVMQKDVQIVTEAFEKMNLKYKIQEAIKVDHSEYCLNGKFRSFK